MRRYRADHQKTHQGALRHAAAQSRYRQRFVARLRQKVTDHPSPPLKISPNMSDGKQKATHMEDKENAETPRSPGGTTQCDFCGRSCGPFIHRWLGRW